MNKPTDRFDEHEWRLQERALREERLHAEDGGDPDVAAYRRIVRALREAPADALPPDFAEAVAAQAARLPARGESSLERWLMRMLVAAFVVSALYFVANDGGAWMRASLSLLPKADVMALRSWGLALGGCVAMTWAFGRLRIDNGGHAR
jgi:anti-sigma factor RsiW